MANKKLVWEALHKRTSRPAGGATPSTSPPTFEADATGSFSARGQNGKAMGAPRGEDNVAPRVALESQRNAQRDAECALQAARHRDTDAAAT